MLFYGLPSPGYGSHHKIVVWKSGVNTSIQIEPTLRHPTENVIKYSPVINVLFYGLQGLRNGFDQGIIKEKHESLLACEFNIVISLRYQHQHQICSVFKKCAILRVTI